MFDPPGLEESLGANRIKSAEKGVQGRERM
jgi:hypothetical protein